MLLKYYPHAYADSVFSIDYEKLYNSGCKAVLFDIDNTLVHHSDDSNERVDRLFADIEKVGLKPFLLSDNSKERIERFNKNINAPYIAEADKPNPDSYHKALKMLGVEKSEAVVIGDQIFKDILGANNAGIPSILVRFIRLDSEKKIGKKRYLEYLILGFYKRNKKYYNRIKI